MKCLVTGATGFVGANLVRKLLQDNHEVFIITRKTSNEWRITPIKKYIHSYYSDLTNRNVIFELVATIKPDIIFHTATYGGFPHQLDNNSMLAANLMGTINLLDAAVKYQVPQFINTGSSSEYGLKNAPMKETDRCDPLSFYGLTKLAATNYCTLIGKTLPYSVCTLRLFSPYGELEDSSRLYPTIKNALIQGERAHLGKPDAVRDFIPMAKVCKIYSKIPTTNYQAGDIINVGSGRQQTISEFYTQVASSLGSTLQPLWNEMPPRNFEPTCWEAAISKLRSLLPAEFAEETI